MLAQSFRFTRSAGPLSLSAFVLRSLLLSSIVALAAPGRARAIDGDGALDFEQPKLINARMVGEMHTASPRSRVSSTNDTTFVGFVPGKVGPGNYWGIGKGSNVGYPSAPADYGVWTWDGAANIAQVHGDSLFGWWPYRNVYNASGGLTLPDDQRPWWAIDIGNNANYVINQGPGLKRTFGIVGVWHVDDGSASGGGVTWNTSSWGAAANGKALWCGLRRHGDLAFVDDPARGGTGNPFNAQVLANSGQSGGTTGGGIATNQKFPGYGSQWDQLAYRDLDVTGKSSVTLRFKLRTNMSTAYGTSAQTRTGWFDKDPRGPAIQTNPASLNNFISSSAAGTSAPIDSFMVYVGAGVGYAAGSNWRSTDGVTYTVYDPQRRWLSETLRVNEPAVPYREVFTTYGDNAASKNWGHGDASGVARSLTAPVDASWNNRARVVFRNKTNRGFDDEGGSVTGAYSSNGAGAVVIDDIEVSYDGGANFSSLTTFENAGDVDNRTSVDPLNAFKTTGKPEGVFDHVHNVSDLIYEDICGNPGSLLRICNLDGNVISSGDHDHSERAGGVYGTAGQELANSFFSPTIQLVNHNTTNVMDMNPAIAQPTDDYYISFEIYTGIYDFFSQGNYWRFAISCYPAKQKDGTLCWGDWRIPGITPFNPTKECFRDFEGGYQLGIVSFSSADAQDAAFGFYPDSIRIMLGKIQQCFRFSIPSANCASTDGGYWDNVSLAIVDGKPVPISIDMWQLINDTFTVNGKDNRTNVLPGTADFDTTTALVKIGLNISQTSTYGGPVRYTVPGDTSTVLAYGDGVDMYLVFRINPGPGNYTTIGNPSSSLRRVPTGTAPVNISVPQVSPANFWEQYLIDNGSRGTPTGHPPAGVNGGRQWDPTIWNSARCDTAEGPSPNLYCINTRFIGQPLSGLWSSMYIEQDPKFTTLGVDKNRCFLKTATNAVTQANTTCNLVNNPTDGWEITSGYTTEIGLAHGHTYEYTKILPDGQFTPGTHVEYFFERVDEAGSGGPCESAPCLAPDTSTVSPQVTEGSTDGHRWQEFSVLPDAWKFAAYGGLGQACMLYVDLDDRRGDERVWVSIADSIGATRAAKYGAHNGWHAPGTGADAVNDPANFVHNRNEQPGTTWDMFGTKGAESLNSKSGSIGSWFGNHAASAVDYKWSYLGPSLGMLEAYYKVLLILSGDLNSTVIGPSTNFESDDVQMIQDFMAGGSVGNYRGVFIEGDGFVESAFAGGNYPQLYLMTDWFKLSLRDPSYLALSKSEPLCLDLIASPPIGTSQNITYGVRNSCVFTNDVLQVQSGGQESARYSPNGVASGPLVAGVYHDASSLEPYFSVVDGWDVANLRSRYCEGTFGRRSYYFNTLTNVFGSICNLVGTNTDPGDVPGGRPQDFVDFVNLRNNPVRSGWASVDLGVAKSDRVEVKVFDIGGRLVRTLADRQFAPGRYTLTWDGADNGGRQVARGVYFTQVRYVSRGINEARKLTLLK